MAPRSVLVIIVNYKSAALALKCVDSLDPEFKNPDLDLRVVVVENDSGDADELRQKLAGRNGVSLVVAEKNGGFAYGNNRGFHFAYESGFKPDYFHLLNPDTQAYPGTVSELVRFLDEHPRAAAAGSSIHNVDGTDWSTAFRFPTVASEIDSALKIGVVTKLLDRWVVPRKMGADAEQVDWLVGASMMIRREVIEQLGGLDEEYFLYFEETDFCLKIARAGWERWYVPQSRVMHLTGQSTGISSHHREPNRFPGYWFDSRRRFFAKNYGVGYAAVTDAAFAAAWGLGRAKRLLQGRGRQDPPRFLRDLLTHSPLWAENRAVESERCFHAPS